MMSQAMNEVTAEAASFTIGAVRVDVVVGDFEETIGTLAAEGHSRLHCGEHGILRAQHDFINFALARGEMAVCRQGTGDIGGVA